MRANVEDRSIKGDYATDGGLLIVSVFLQVLLAMCANVKTAVLRETVRH